MVSLFCSQNLYHNSINYCWLGPINSGTLAFSGPCFSNPGFFQWNYWPLKKIQLKILQRSKLFKTDDKLKKELRDALRLGLGLEYALAQSVYLNRANLLTFVVIFLIGLLAEFSTCTSADTWLPSLKRTQKRYERNRNDATETAEKDRTEIK